MTNQPNEPQSTLLALPDFDKLKQQVSILATDGNTYTLDAYSIFDFIPESGEYLPLLCAGQADEKNGSYKEGKKDVYPLDKKLYLSRSSYGETEDSEKPKTIRTFQALPENSTTMIPVAVDSTRRYWEKAYSAEDISEPDCQSNTFMVLPVPDARYLNFDERGIAVSGKYSHACKWLNPQTMKAEDYCPLSKWANNQKPPCIQFVSIYGLIDVNSALELVEVRFKRSSYKSGEKALRKVIKSVKENNRPYEHLVKMTHEKADEDRSGYTIYALTQDTLYSPDDTTLETIIAAMDKANSIIAANRARATVRSDAPVNTVIEGEVIDDAF